MNIDSSRPGELAGMTFKELVSSVSHNVRKELFPKPGSVSRYTKVVQLDLEANGLIERIPGEKPQRIRRMDGRRRRRASVLGGH